MPKRILACLGLAATLFGTTLTPALADTAFVESFQSRLAAADLAVAEALALTRITADPSDPQARFALGTAQFLGAVEGLGRGLYDHGLTASETMNDYIPGVTDLPFLRMPVAENPDPAPFTAEVMRQILGDFDTALQKAEATLAEVPKGLVQLPLDVRQIAFDYNRDGKAGPGEDLPTLILAI